MERQRKYKFIVMITLMLVVVGMSLGFAAFSSTLNISSSASVTPSSDDFSVTLYGFKDEEAKSAFNAAGNIFSSEYFVSDSAWGATSSPDLVKVERAIIDNSTYSITVPEVGIFGEFVSVTYHILIMNDGEYDVYVDLSDYKYDSNVDVMFTVIEGVCTPDEGTSLELTNAACSSVVLQPCFTQIGNCVMNTDEHYYLIPKGEFGVLSVVVGSSTFTTKADGPFSVTFPEYKLNISTAK